MVSKVFKKSSTRLPLDFFSTLFLSFLSLKAALQRLAEVFWVVVYVKNLTGGGCFYRAKGVAGRPAGGAGRSHLPFTRMPSPPSISCCLPTLE
jgi:hypothetical protein